MVFVVSLTVWLRLKMHGWPGALLGRAKLVARRIHQGNHDYILTGLPVPGFQFSAANKIEHGRNRERVPVEC